ncbi:uncharacterized protein LOC105663578 [Megachile rotundata]|uniref:uncharacterized protein LOC105663578 n=1 Tax=Megachile rotundata TaxID=143995 RepID=UPI003FD53964
MLFSTNAMGHVALQVRKSKHLPFLDILSSVLEEHSEIMSQELISGNVQYFYMVSDISSSNILKFKTKHSKSKKLESTDIRQYVITSDSSDASSKCSTDTGSESDSELI